MGELEALKPDLEKAGERIITERQPYEVSEELKLVSAQLQKLQDLPEDAERIYKDYMGNIEGLKDKLKQLQENKKLMLQELEERKKAWRTRDPEPHRRDHARLPAGALDRRRDAEPSGSTRGTASRRRGSSCSSATRAPSPAILDPYTQSGGERSVALVAFMLSLQSRIISPLRAMDEFDIHMDPRNREAIFKMILARVEAEPQLAEHRHHAVDNHGDRQVRPRHHGPVCPRRL